MRFEVVTGVEEINPGGVAAAMAGAPELEDVFDLYEGDGVSWVTEPSGVLVVMDGSRPVFAYAVGSWLRVRPAQ